MFGINWFLGDILIHVWKLKKQCHINTILKMISINKFNPCLVKIELVIWFTYMSIERFWIFRILFLSPWELHLIYLWIKSQIKRCHSIPAHNLDCWATNIKCFGLIKHCHESIIGLMKIWYNVFDKMYFWKCSAYESTSINI